MLIPVLAAAALFTHSHGWYLASASFDFALLLEVVANGITLVRSARAYFRAGA